MAYAKGTGTSFNGYAKTRRTNPARVGTATMVPSTGGYMTKSVPVARKPAKNKAAK